MKRCVQPCYFHNINHVQTKKNVGRDLNLSIGNKLDYKTMVNTVGVDKACLILTTLKIHFRDKCMKD